MRDNNVPWRCSAELIFLFHISVLLLCRNCSNFLTLSYWIKQEQWSSSVVTVQQVWSSYYEALLRHRVRINLGMCTVLMKILHFAVTWSARKWQFPTCHHLQAQKKFGSSLHASALSAGLAFWTPLMVLYMQPCSLLNQMKPGHIIYFCCLNQRTVSLQLERFLKHHNNFSNDLSGYSFHLIAGFWKNKQSKEQWLRNIPLPVIRKICNNYSFCKNH